MCFLVGVFTFIKTSNKIHSCCCTGGRGDSQPCNSWQQHHFCGAPQHPHPLYALRAATHQLWQQDPAHSSTGKFLTFILQFLDTFDGFKSNGKIVKCPEAQSYIASKFQAFCFSNSLNFLKRVFHKILT
jgi:hypothetical protein